MSKVRDIFLWILMGALASGLGLGYFLHKANQDRARLVQEAEQTTKEIQQTADTLAQEANQKLMRASIEMMATEKRIHLLEMERTLLTQAVRLDPLPTRNLIGWQPALSWPLGLNLELPPNATSTLDHQILTASLTKPLEGGSNWLVISPYADDQETRLASLLQAPTSSAAYLIGGRLLIGQTGTVGDTHAQAMVLRVSNNASSTHLIWIQERPGLPFSVLLKVLSTLGFRT